MPDILVMGPMIPLVMEQLETNYRSHYFWQQDDKAAFLDAHKGGIQAIATDGHLGASAELMAQLPQLKIIACYGVGVDAIDVDYARAHNIAVTNTPGVLSEDVADLAILLFLALHRNILAADDHVRKGAWLKGALPLGRKFSNCHLGIVGIGRIGQEIAQRAQAFGCQISYHARTAKDLPAWQYYADLKKLAQDVDHLCVITSGGSDTYHLITGEILKALGPEGFLINVARGSVVDECALIHALQNGIIAGAGLDVFADEPRVPQELIAMDNVVLTPHMASATDHTRNAMGQLVVDNLAAWFNGQPLITAL